MSYNNSNLVHTWAQQNKESGKSSTGNCSFHGRSLYSYSTEIARFIDGRAVYTSHTYSVTTSGKHQRHIYSAVNHVENYCVSLEMRDIPDNWNDAAPVIFSDMLYNIKKQIETILRARKVEFQIERLTDQVNAAHAFYARYIHDLYIMDLPIIPSAPEYITIPDLLALHSNVAGFDIAQVLQDRFGADLKAKIARERESAKLDRARKLERAENLKRMELEELEKWRAGENSRSFYSLPVALRINGDVIETSHGARVPLNEAIDLWRAIQTRSFFGKKIGEFTVNHLENEVLTIGCHKIPFLEVEKIAQALKLVGAPIQ